MSTKAKSPPVSAADTSLDEDRVMQSLIQRALISPEEAAAWQKARPNQKTDVKGILNALVKAGHLTDHQAQRLAKELQETQLNQQIPGYKVLGKIGQGSMGTVYKARQLSMNRLVAIKILQPRLAAVEGYLNRFYREAHLAAQLSHAHIVQAIDAGAAGSINYFVMEYVDGMTIQDVLSTGKKYGEKTAVSIILQVARALEHAHQRKLVHRDIKPANIMIAKDGVVKLADMGIARHVEDEELAKAEKGKTIGTPYYIAPELVHGKFEADVRADIYSLGATLYHMVTGRPPFLADSVADVIRARLTQELVPPDHLNMELSAGLGETVEFMMARERGDRYQTPAELITDLECLQRGDPPKIARQRAGYSKFKDLESGETIAEPEKLAVAQNQRLKIVAIVLAVLLGLSTLVNLLLLFK